MGDSVGIVGGSGYASGELVRLLDAHPALALRVVAGRTSAGTSLREVFPHLDVDGTVAAAHPDALDGCDVVVLATPHEVSLDLAPELIARGQQVVDLSAAFRLPPDVFGSWYLQEHPAPHLAPAPYGLPELFRDAVGRAGLVANPGCYPTAALLALAPLAGAVAPDSVTVAGLSGTSGAGRGLRDDLHVTHAAGNAGVYSVPGHRHIPEIEQAWSRLSGVDAAVTFVPHLLPIPRGLLCTVTAQLAPGVAADEVHERLDARYAHEPLVRVLPPGTWPQLAYVQGSAAAHVAAAVDERSGRAVVCCALDNLGKGAAAQAVQNLNLLRGLPETTGLSGDGLYP